MKAFIDEPGSEHVRSTLEVGEPISSSRLAYVECCAAIARLERERFISRRDADRASKELGDRWQDVAVVELDDQIMRSAGVLVRDLALRGADGIHLASARTIHDRTPGDVRFVCWDDRLRAGAASIGLTLSPP